MAITGDPRARRRLDLEDKYRVEDGEILLTGVQALVRVVFDQLRADRSRGLRTAAFVSGYQGSPLGGFDQALARSGELLTDLDVHLVPGVNEELAATAVWGSQQDHLAPLARHDGVIGCWYAKAPGLDRAGDALRHANLHGVGRNGGVLCAVGDDPQSKSSTFPSGSELALADLSMPILTPGTPQEVLDLGRHAYEMSRYSGCWSAMKIVTAVADGLASATVHPERVDVRRPDLAFDGVPWEFHQIPRFFLPETIALEAELFERRIPAARSYAEANGLNVVEVEPPEARIAIVAPGRTYHEVREALARLGLADDALARAGVRLVRLGLVYPLDPGTVRRVAAGVEDVLVVEEKRSFVEAQLRQELYDAPRRPRVLGKLDLEGRPLVPMDGELTSDRLREPLARVLSGRLDGVELAVPRASIAVTVDAPARTAMFCSGCPHNTSTVEASDSPVGGGVGCHALAMNLDRGAVSYTQMGGEGAHWIGRAPFTDVGHFVQNVGDGTFFHSASLVVRAAVSAGTTMTFKLLYNGVVAMTGGQDPAGQMELPQLCRSLLAEGVTRVAVVSDEPDRLRDVTWPDRAALHGRDELATVERELASIPGVTVLVYEQACANELRRLRKRGRAPLRTTRVVVNELVCEGCGDCGAKSNCLSVQPVDTELGRRTQIDQTTCNTDYSCLDGDCPSFVTFEIRPGARATRRPPRLPEVPDPAVAPIGDDGHGIVLAGIGGTGVVTLNQVLATAAFLEGLHVTGLDQTGLAQKAGPVVSHLRCWSSAAVSANSVPEGGADVLLALDPLVAVDPRHLARTDPSRTAVVATTAIVPTAEMVRDPDAAPANAAALLELLGSRSRPGAFVALDTIGLAESLFGDSASANVLALGAASQLGVLPVSAASIRRAIELNGVAVERNLTAFDAGRVAVAKPDALPAPTRPGAIERRPRPAALRAAGALVESAGLGADVDVDLERIVRRAAELVEYQDERLAGRLVALVADAVRAARRVGADPRALASAVADGHFHLLAYKDEYEVARLHLLPEADAAVRAAVPGGRGMRYRLHPPFLRAMGLRRKLALPAWFARPAFRVLRSMRRLRGTPLDVFGWSRIRRLERRLASEHESDLRGALGRMRMASDLDLVVELAELPKLVRGYEQLKVDSAVRYEAAKAALLDRLPG